MLATLFDLLLYLTILACVFGILIGDALRALRRRRRR